MKTVLDLPGGQGNTILIVYAVGSILIKVVLVMGMGIGTIAFLSGMQGGRSASPGSSLSASLDESGAAGEMEGSKQFVEAAAEEFAGQVAAELNKMLGEQGSASSIQTSVVVKDSSGSRSESYDMKGRFVRGLASGGVAQDMEPAEAAAQLKQEFDAAMAEPAVESPGTTGEPDPLAGVEAEETMRAPGKGADPEEIKRANELVQQARLKWNEGDYKGSLAAGDEAVAILKANLPEGNPKLRKVMRMSATAKERAATKGIE
ncbi:hypothetical protein HYR69_01750 [Candidatus Sumerlaeota bacterium]|nr:hypothetical protein [Candidatus Sumerlaeota bacterium]